MQEKMRKLVEESGKKKKEKKKQKEKDKDKTKKLVPNSSNMGKPGAHGALTKSNSIITDSVDDSIASVVSGADLKMTGELQHPAGSKSLGVHHAMAAGANAATKPPKSKGETAHSSTLLVDALLLRCWCSCLPLVFFFLLTYLCFFYCFLISLFLFNSI